MEQVSKFSGYQILMTVCIALIQFSVVLDFMVLSPLGPFVMKDLHINEQQFGVVVSAYAFSCCISAIVTAGFADRFDRKKMLLFFFSGFILGTLLCAMSTSYAGLLAARIVTGIFGGVMGSISMAIITDLFEQSKRGRIMGFVQMSFGVSQILGIPLGLWLTVQYDWHIPFYAIVGFAVLVLLLIVVKMKPVDGHLALQSNNNAFVHLWHTLKNKRYLRGFLATTLLATGGFMLMPFGSDFALHNLKIKPEDLTPLYMITGVFTFFSTMASGFLADKVGKMVMFTFGTVLSAIIVLIYTQLGPSPLWLIIVLNVVLFIGINSRIVPAQALLTSVPEPKDRGAFMSLNSAVQYLSGGISAFCAGLIVYKGEDDTIHNYPILGIVVTCTMAVALILMFRLSRMLKKPVDQTPKLENTDLLDQ